MPRTAPYLALHAVTPPHSAANSASGTAPTTATAPLPLSARPLPAQPLRGPRRLSSAAGFLHSAAAAHQVAQDLRLAFSLDAQQVSVLAPIDAQARRFDQVSRRWSRVLPSADERHGVWALALGLAAVVALLALDLQLGAVLAGLGALVLAGALVASLRPQPNRFDRTVQMRLANGAWAVLVCDVPGALQADVLTALRYNSRQWCADAPHRRRL